MTVVVGVRGKRGVLLAADSQWSGSWSNRKRTNGKTVSLSDLVAVGYCGSARLGQILAYHCDTLTPPALGGDELRWAVRSFVPFLRDVTLEHGALHIKDEVEQLADHAAFLLAVRGRLFAVECDLQVGEHVLPYEALGSGEEAAIGAMQALAGDGRAPLGDQRLRRVAVAGIEAAAEFTNHVGGDITFTSTVAYTDAEKQLARRVLSRR